MSTYSLQLKIHKLNLKLYFNTRRLRLLKIRITTTMKFYRYLNTFTKQEC